jgi:UDP-N-acetylmuramate--alanine ligase
MIEFNKIISVYFLGIGGIGMSALARYFNHLGLTVCGYDRTPSRLTNELEDEGIAIHYHDMGQEVMHLAVDTSTTLVVVTPALPQDFGEWQWFLNHGFRVLKRSEVLGIICNRQKCLAVAGTHGKTTVSTMTAVILKNSSVGCGAFLGGISINFNNNLVLPGEEEQWLVTEADEYDRSFLQLTPDIAVITYMDADHLDIYGQHDALINSFKQFASQIRPGGNLIIRKELESSFHLPGIRIFTYSLNEEADFCVDSLQLNVDTRCYSFRIKTPHGLSPRIEMHYPGILNVENGLAAAAAASLAGATLNEIAGGLEIYMGVKRRFEIRFRNKKNLYIDDYAHHPAELKAFISSVRLLFPDKKITGIFQPHLFTRTRDFAGEFAESLDLLDCALLLPVYPARELPIEGVSSALILQLMTLPNRKLIMKSDIPAFIKSEKPDILLTMGAGDIDLVAEEIISILKDEIDC